MVEAKYHLLLVYKPGLLDPDDFHQIGSFVHAKTPDIEPFVISDSIDPCDDLERATTKPFLLFAPTQLEYFQPKGGKIYCGQLINKLDQMEAMRRLGIPVPKWTVIKPNTRLSARDWGPTVVVKPVFGSLSKGVELQMTEAVRFRVPLFYPPDHPGRSGPMIAQAFVDTGARPRKYRVLTLFGEPLYSEEIASIEETPLPAELNSDTVKTIKILQTTGTRHRSFAFDEDVLDLARRAARALPRVPLLAFDILREKTTRKLYVLETNPGGNTWHFSSPGGRKELVGDQQRHVQFNAFERAADLLINRTLKEAR
jgi:hypothetical protein